MNKTANSLTKEVRQSALANSRPRDAATLMIVDKRAGKPYVLIGKRHERHRFLPGKYVFPGGRLDLADGGVPAASEFDERTVTRLLDRMRGKPTRRRARGLALAAVRETYEEAGLLVGQKGQATPSPNAAEWHGFYGHGVVPDLSTLSFIARAITPPRRPRRFDTRFFVAHADQIALELPASERPTDELSDLHWLPIDEMPGLDLPKITQVVLELLNRRLSEPGGLDADAPIPFYYMLHGSFVREDL